MILLGTFLLCLEVFFARILDVSIGVIRNACLIQENTKKAVFLAFLEVLIWFLVAREALIRDATLVVAICYSLGYATGTYLGSFLVKLFLKGSVGVQVISSNFKRKDIFNIKSLGYGVSVVNLSGRGKKLLLLEVEKKRLKELLKFLFEIDERAFITVSDRRFIQNGYLK